MGMVRNAVLMSIFGAGNTTDVIISTFNVPNSLRKLMAEGGLSAAFIPVFSRSVATGDKKDHRLLNSLITFQIMLISLICVFAIIFAKPLITAILTEFKEPEQIKLAVVMFRWFISYILLISLSATFMGVLNSNEIFVIPALTPLIFSFTVIPSLIFLHAYIGPYALVVGVLTGGLGQIMFQLPSIFRCGYSPKPVLDFRYEEFMEVMKRWGPVVLTSSVMIINQTVATRFATGLGEGSATALNNAIIFWQVPFGMITASIGTVLFPKMSKQAAAKDFKGFGESVSYGIRFLLLMLIPSMIGYLLFGKQIVAVIFLDGKYTIENVIKTNTVLRGYTAGLLFAGLFNFLQRPLYSMGKYRFTFYVSIIICSIDIILSVILKSTSLKVSGLAYANSIAYTSGSIIYLVYIRTRLCRIPLRPVIYTGLKTVVPGAVITSIILLFNRYMKGWWTEGRTIGNFSVLMVFTAVLISIVFALYYAEKEDIIITMIKRKSGTKL